MVHDLSEIFDDVEEEVYADSCCHYTEKGEEVLSTVVANVVASAVSEELRHGTTRHHARLADKVLTGRPVM